MSTRCINVDHVLPRRRPYPPPGDVVHLSFLDVCWISLPPTRRFFLFPDAAGVPFPSLVHTLKSALSEALLLYHPLAGKLTYLPDTGDVVVDCSSDAVGDGVPFVVAESDSDVGRLLAEPTHDVEAFSKLVPELDAGSLPAPVFAVQVTRFAAGGGVAVGYAAHHAVVDGQAVWRFLEAWARACRREEAPVGLAPVTHDRAVVRHRHPKSEEIARRYLRAIAPALPQITDQSVVVQSCVLLTRRNFMIEAKPIKSLKQAVLISSGLGEDQVPSPSPSTFTVLSAYAWISFAHAKAINDDEVVLLCLAADCRARLDPPISEGYTGNCVRSCYASAMGSELRGTGNLRQACMAIQQAIRVFSEDPLKGCEDSIDRYLSRVASSRIMYVVGSPRFRAYEMDFGWGRPNKVELVSMNHDGEVVLLGGKERGEVQVSVSLSAFDMDAFASMFVAGLGPTDVAASMD